MLQAISLYFIDRIFPPVNNGVWHLGVWEEMAGWILGVQLR